MNDLFSPVKMGSVELKNGIFMAPLTRNRAHDDTDIPNDLAITYYSQRASAGLIIAEGTQISNGKKSRMPFTTKVERFSYNSGMWVESVITRYSLKASNL